MDVVVWSTKSCVQCMQTKRKFDTLGIRYTEKSLEDNPDALEQFKSKGFASAPIVEAGSRIWSGFRHAEIQTLQNILFGEPQTNG